MGEEEEEREDTSGCGASGGGRMGGGEEGRRRGGEEERRRGGEEERRGGVASRREGGEEEVEEMGTGKMEERERTYSPGEWYSLVCENGREVFGDVNVQHCREVLILIYLHHVEDAHLTNTQRSKIKGQRSEHKLLYY